MKILRAGPMAVRPDGVHTNTVSWCGVTWQATDTELHQLWRDIGRLLADKHFQLENPRKTT